MRATIVICLALFVVSALAQLNQIEKDKIVAKHNQIRSLVAQGKVKNWPEATNMNQVFWDNTLAEAAQKQLDNSCVIQQGPKVIDPRWNTIGKNFGGYDHDKKTDPLDVDGILEGWLDEAKAVKPTDTQYRKYGSSIILFAHMVWADTTSVGCGVCQNGDSANGYETLLLCLYGADSYSEGSWIYKAGNQCSGCAKGCGSVAGLCK
jgi:hypothetical protein